MNKLIYFLLTIFFLTLTIAEMHIVSLSVGAYYTILGVVKVILFICTAMYTSHKFDVIMNELVDEKTGKIKKE
jgi:hypothetical protein